jgi:3-phosphoshikimate 1-carboxyvinyltransferase
VASAPVEVTVPGDKSISHRALIFGALAQGESRLEGLLDAADTRSTAAVLAALGVSIGSDAADSSTPPSLAGTVTVRGVGPHGLLSPDTHLDCGNSGTSARLLLGALAGASADAVLTGDESLRRRPMRRVTEPLSRVGARFVELEAEDRLPIRVRGVSLEPIDMLNPRSSAQVKTAMLLAGLTAGVPVRVTEPGRSRDHSERMLRAMGAPLTSTAGPDGFVTRLDRCDRLEPLELRVPGDISSAAFFLALGALRGPVRVRGVGLNPSRAGALQVMRRMGVRLEIQGAGEVGGEPVGAVTVRPGELVGTVVEPMEVPTLIDEVPVLAVLAARAAGETRFEGVGELRVKESDRIDALVQNFHALGVDAEAGPDTLQVRGAGRALRGEVDAFGDHRIAMAFGILAALPGNEIRVRGRAAVGISYPGFWDELERVNTELEAK